MKLYYAKGACSLVPHIIINEIGLTSDYELVDLATKKTAAGDNYLTINPKGAVPALRMDNGEILTENTVILQYLADTTHATALLPPVGEMKRYRVLEWLNYATTELHKGFGQFFNPNFPQEVKENILIPLMKTKFNYIDKQLNNKTYLLGDDFTLPDAYLFVMLMWALHFKFDITAWPNLSRYFAELKKRQSIMKTLQEEGLNL